MLGSLVIVRRRVVGTSLGGLKPLTVLLRAQALRRPGAQAPALVCPDPTEISAK